jgi:uncharacterized membrane protein HdeD (DUF308 family)
LNTTTLNNSHTVSLKMSGTWLQRYYFARAIFSFLWVAAAFTLASFPAVVAGLLIIYPVWDAAANLVDARRNGGLKRNISQAANTLLSSITAVAIAVVLGQGMNAVVGVFGAWAIVSGISQLVTAARRWKRYGAQWIMILSGAQSALAGGFFINLANEVGPHGITDLAPYAAFGGFYFLVSALWLVVSTARSSKRH